MANRRPQPTTGLPHERLDSATARKVAQAMARYNSIFIFGPMHRTAFAGLEGLRQLAIATPGQRQMGIRMLGASGSGKTSCFLAYSDFVAKQEGYDPDICPVVHLPLDRASSPRRLFASLLEALGDHYTVRGTEAALRQRAYTAMKRLGVQLLGVDEVQHLSFRSTALNDVTDSLKRFLDDACVPLCLIGTEAAKAFLENNIQLSNRLLPPIDFKPLRSSNPTDRKHFEGFVGRLDDKLVAEDLTRMTSNLRADGTLAGLFAVSTGVLGRVSNILKIALGFSVRRDADFIELCDLHDAVQSWAIDQSVVTENPFDAA